MLNSCVVNPKVDPLSLHNCNCALDATTSGIEGSHTPIRGLVRSVLSLQHEICVLQATTGRCGTWQRGYESVSFVAWYSFLHYQADLDEAWNDDAVHPGSLLRIRGGPLHGDSRTIQGHSPCNHPPSICGAWAASAHGRLLGTIQYCRIKMKLWLYVQRHWNSSNYWSHGHPTLLQKDRKKGVDYTFMAGHFYGRQ